MARWVLIIASIAYVLALGIFLVGTYGLFGAETDPLSGIYLIPLGMPWVLLADYLPASVSSGFAIVAPVINLFMLWLILRRFLK